MRWQWIRKYPLLHERKRHAARRVVSTPSVVLTGYPPSWPGGVPCRGGVPSSVHTAKKFPWPDLAGGVPYLGTPQQGTPWQGTPQQDTPLAGYPWQGTPPAGYPPPPRWTWQGTPPPPRCLLHGILGNVEKHYGIWVPPPGVHKLTKWNYYLPVVLRTRTVKMAHSHTRISCPGLCPENGYSSHFGTGICPRFCAV